MIVSDEKSQYHGSPPLILSSSPPRIRSAFPFLQTDADAPHCPGIIQRGVDTLQYHGASAVHFDRPA